MPASLRELALGKVTLDALEEERTLSLRNSKVSELKVCTVLWVVLGLVQPNSKCFDAALQAF